MASFLWFLLVLTLIIFSLFFIYTCMSFWINCRQASGPPQIVYPAEQRTSVVKESAYISVFYHRNEVKTAVVPATAGSLESVKSDSGDEGGEEDNSNEAKWKKIEALREEQKKSAWNAEKLGCDLVIGASATREKVAGYLLDLKNRVCEFYTYDLSVLPWTINEPVTTSGSAGARGDAVENEEVELLREIRSKNLMFALLLWEDKLKEMKKFKLYTDDESIRWPESKYGIRVRGHLTHLEECEKVVKMNTTIVLDEDDLDKYVRFLLPAVELSLVGIKRFQSYVSAAYGIERFEGTHEYIRDEKSEGGDKKAVYMATKFFNNYQLKVQKKVTNHIPCHNCKYSLARSASLRSLNGPDDRHPVDEIDSPRRKTTVATGRAPPPCTLNRKSHPKGFPSLNFRTWGHTSDERDYYQSKKRRTRRRDLDPESGTPGAESEDDVSISSKATSGGGNSSKSTFSSKKTMRLDP